MSGPSFVVRVLGDLKGLSSAVDQAASKGTGAAGKLKSAFSGTLGALNKSGVLGPFADALDGVTESLDKIGGHGKALGVTMMGVGGTMAGVGVALSALGSKEKAAHEQLKQAVENTGASYDDYAKRIDAAAKHNERFGYTTHQTDDALRILTQATKSPEKALQMMGTAADLAAAKHEDLQTAATQLGRAYNGAGKIFKEFGVVAAPKAAAASKALATATRSAASADDHAKTARQKLTDYLAVYNSKSKHTVAEQQHLRNAMQAVGDADQKAREAHLKLAAAQENVSQASKGTATNMAALAKAVHGQADVAADTFTGHLKAMGATIEDAAAKFGEKFGPALTVAGTALAGLGGAMTASQGIIGLFTKGQETAAVATEAVTAAEGTEAVASWAALGPILLIIGAIAALVAIGFVIYKNWDTIWNGIKTIVSVVWDWIASHWPLLLAILLGPIGIAAALIISNFDRIKAFIAAVFGWIVDHWQLLLAILIGPIGIAAALIIGNFDRIKGAAAAVWNWISSAWSAITGWLTGPFTSAANTIRSTWDGVVSFVQGIPGRISGFLSGLFDPALDAVHRVTDTIESVWNNTIGRLKPPSFPGSGVLHKLHVPGFQHGGYVADTGLALVHAGEYVLPAGNVAHAGTSTGSGPSVWIEHVTVAETLDVDAFLRRAAWAVQRERI